ncbi:hypothetical protein G6F56_012167 [Rhizopus delemar]|nr:hypothetical protein G6F56_012167 [Rhizopus delemar]
MPEHLSMITRANKLKKPLPRNSNFVDRHSCPCNYMVVKIIPVSLFSDDTSGNRTKKWNCFDTWSMVPLAIPLSMRNQYISQSFVCGSNRLVATQMLPPIVDDLLKLEEGMEMFAEEHDETVLVTFPLTFMSADNPRHADIANIKQSTANFCCRKCYWKRVSNRYIDTFQIKYKDYCASMRLKEHHILYSFGNKNLEHGIEVTDMPASTTPQHVSRMSPIEFLTIFLFVRTNLQ